MCLVAYSPRVKSLSVLCLSVRSAGVAKCCLCRTDVNYSKTGKKSFISHCSTNRHMSAMVASSGSTTMDQFFDSPSLARAVPVVDSETKEGEGMASSTTVQQRPALLSERVSMLEVRI